MSGLLEIISTILLLDYDKVGSSVFEVFRLGAFDTVLAFVGQPTFSISGRTFDPGSVDAFGNDIGLGGFGPVV